MTGSFTSDGEPALSVRVSGPAGGRDVEAIVDTGFNGGLTLPRGPIDALDLPRASETKVTLADGRVREVQLYGAGVSLDGHTQEVLVAVSPATPLLGTDLLWGFSLYIEFQADGSVEVAPLNDNS